MTRAHRPSTNPPVRRAAVRAALLVALAVLAAAAPVPSALGSSAASADPGAPAVLSGLDCVVEPSTVVDVGVAVPGVLESTRHDRGDAVAAGALMARLESEVEEVAVAIAAEIAASGTAVALRETTSAFGVRTLTRNERLAGADEVSEQALDEVRTEASIADLQLRREREGRTLARLELARARAELARREIRSPIDGRVLERFHEAGEHVDAEPVYRVARLDPLHVEVIAPVEYLGVLAEGMRAGVTIAAPGYADRPLAATLSRIDPVGDAASGTFGVRLELPNPGRGVPSGVRCSVDFFAS